MNRFFRSICLAAAAGAFFQASAQIQLDYYRSLDGLSGAQLKNAIHTLVCTDVNMLKYGSGSATATSTWWGFYVTDRDVTNNQVIDRYSAEVFTFGTRGQSVSGMNIEHSFPKSWWGGEQNNAYKDLYNLMPSQTTINNWKGNYPMGQVDDVWRTNNVTEIGTAAGTTNNHIRFNTIFIHSRFGFQTNHRLMEKNLIENTSKHITIAFGSGCHFNRLGNRTAKASGGARMILKNLSSNCCCL